MTEQSEARWDPPPTEPPLVGTSLESVFLDEDLRALLDEELDARAARAPIGFAPPPVSRQARSHRRTHRTRPTPGPRSRAPERATT